LLEALCARIFSWDSWISGFSDFFFLFFFCVCARSRTKPFFRPSQPGSCAWELWWRIHHRRSFGTLSRPLTFQNRKSIVYYMVSGNNQFQIKSRLSWQNWFQISFRLFKFCQIKSTTLHRACMKGQSSVKGPSADRHIYCIMLILILLVSASYRRCQVTCLVSAAVLTFVHCYTCVNICVCKT